MNQINLYLESREKYQTEKLNKFTAKTNQDRKFKIYYNYVVDCFHKLVLFTYFINHFINFFSLCDDNIKKRSLMVGILYFFDVALFLFVKHLNENVYQDQFFTFKSYAEASLFDFHKGRLFDLRFIQRLKDEILNPHTQFHFNTEGLVESNFMLKSHYDLLLQYKEHNIDLKKREKKFLNLEKDSMVGNPLIMEMKNILLNDIDNHRNNLKNFQDCCRISKVFGI